MQLLSCVQQTNRTESQEDSSQCNFSQGRDFFLVLWALNYISSTGVPLEFSKAKNTPLAVRVSSRFSKLSQHPRVWITVSWITGCNFCATARCRNVQDKLYSRQQRLENVIKIIFLSIQCTLYLGHKRWFSLFTQSPEIPMTESMSIYITKWSIIDNVLFMDSNMVDIYGSENHR